MFQITGSSGCNDRDRYIFRNRPCQLQIISGFGSVTVHTGQKNLSCPKCFYFLRPFDRINPHIDTSAIFVNVPATSICPSLGINCHYHALASEFLCRFSHQLRPVNCRRIDGNLIRTFPKQRLEIIDRPDSTAYGKRNKHALGNLAHHVNHCASVIRRCRDIQKYQFIRTGFIVSLRNLNRISCVFEIHKIHTFYNPSVLHIQTWNNSLRKHRSSSYNSTKFFSI